MAVEPRITRSVWIVYASREVRLRGISTEWSSARNASLAISSCDIRTVVRGGVVNCAKCVSSNPTTDRSPGISRANSKALRLTPIAVKSFEQITVEGRTGAAATLARAWR
jgi:hypothetical protein